eukprot:RCo051077
MPFTDICEKSLRGVCAENPRTCGAAHGFGELSNLSCWVYFRDNPRATEIDAARLLPEHARDPSFRVIPILEGLLVRLGEPTDARAVLEQFCGPPFNATALNLSTRINPRPTLLCTPTSATAATAVSNTRSEAAQSPRSSNSSDCKVAPLGGAPTPAAANCESFIGAIPPSETDGNHTVGSVTEPLREQSAAPPPTCCRATEPLMVMTSPDHPAPSAREDAPCRCGLPSLNDPTDEGSSDCLGEPPPVLALPGLSPGTTSVMVRTAFQAAFQITPKLVLLEEGKDCAHVVLESLAQAEEVLRDPLLKVNRKLVRARAENGDNVEEAEHDDGGTRRCEPAAKLPDTARPTSVPIPVPASFSAARVGASAAAGAATAPP